MNKPANYFNDPDEGLSINEVESISSQYFGGLNNIELINPNKTFICFSAMSGSGKSSLAKALEKELQAVRFEADEVKEIVMDVHNLDLDDQRRNSMTWQYMMYLFKNIGSITPNGLIIRDAMIDYYHDRIFPVLKEQGFKIFIIGFDLSEDFVMQKIMERGHKPTITVDKFKELIPMQRQCVDEFRANNHIDYWVNAESWGRWEEIARDINGALR